MNSIEKNGTLNSKIICEQITLLFQSMVYLLIINLVVCILLAVMFWGVVPNTSIYLWTGLMLGMITIRGTLYYIYKQKFDPLNVRFFILFLVIGSATAGVIWGLGGLLLFSETRLEYQVLLVFAFMAMAGGSTFTLSIYMPTYFVYVPVALLPITIKLLTLHSKVHIALAVTTVVFFVVLTLFNIKINRNFRRSLELRFENLQLIEQLKDQRREAERANKAKSSFLAAASHDLRQPLYSLGLFTSVLDESTNDPKTRKIVEQINLAMDSLTSLFEALLDISKLDAGVVEAKKRSFNLQPLFEKLANGFNMQAAEKGLLIQWPQTTFQVTSEANLLEQILRNYLENAIRYTKSGAITVKCIEINGVAVISVSDTGIGLPQEELQDIFIEFHQVGNAERDRKKGIGLGLAIVKRTAKLLGHEISVASEVGVGSTFSIKIPLVEHEFDTQQSLVTQTIPTKSETSLLIALVDDEESIREGLSQLLSLWGYEVIVAASGTKLIEQLEQMGRQPNVLITDYRLANNLTGMDVIAALNAMFQEDIPALIVTGETDKQQIKQMNTENFQVLNKPVHPAKLRAFLRNF
ncbi:MAG: signal transduction histidine kinase [Oleiphilaceae bacterium]|jgi:signal transduction histidine kinase